MKTIGSVVAGTGKVVSETVAAGYVLSDIDCSASTTGSSYATNVTDATVGGVTALGQVRRRRREDDGLHVHEHEEAADQAGEGVRSGGDSGKFNLDITQRRRRRPRRTSATAARPRRAAM